MKLYGTITSERATKGQGGRFLEIKITDEKLKTLLAFTIIPSDTEDPLPAIEIAGGSYEVLSQLCDACAEWRNKLLPGKERVQVCYYEHSRGKYAGLSVPHYHDVETKGKGKKQTDE